MKIRENKLRTRKISAFKMPGKPRRWHSENRNIVCACCLNKDLACRPVTDLGYDSNLNS